MNSERRTFEIDDLRAQPNDDGLPIIRGHAAVFNQWSGDLGGFREQVAPGAFIESLDTDDVRALFNHDSAIVLGRNRSGTLRMHEDETGLAVEITPPDTASARDVVKLIERGDVTNMSFGFRTIQDRWATNEGIDERTLLKVRLFDVSPVTYPAYEQTDVSVRGLDVALSARDAFRQAQVPYRLNAARALQELEELN